ncbi:MAG: hypothetical protein JWO36_6482, partial [Myxococcales bacterium]|nr:hypothetical protein [Myxococcales bacterium]
TVSSATAMDAVGLEQSVVQIVAETSDNARAYVIDETGRIEDTKTFWDRERIARNDRYGKMAPELFAQAQLTSSSNDMITVDIMVVADVPEPQLPYDGTDKYVPITEFEQWFNAQSIAQQPRISAAKTHLLNVLASHGAQIIQNPRGLPSVRASVPVFLLQSQELNGSDIVRIDPVPTDSPHLLSDHAGHTSMNGSLLSGGLSGGNCGGPCDGGSVDVGLWERDGQGIAGAGNASGLARQNTRISTSNSVTGYLECPKVCTVDANCTSDGQTDVERHCVVADAGAQCPTGGMICVQDHLTWVAASVGMYGNYGYNTTTPSGSEDGVPNVPTGGYCTTDPDCAGGMTCHANQCLSWFSSTGAWHVDFRVGNDDSQAGFDY